MEYINVIIRSYKSGSDKVSDDERHAYRTRLLEAVQSVRSHPAVDIVYIVINADPRSAYSETLFDDRTTFTSRIIQREFQDSRVVPIFASTWGENPGSGVPVNPLIQRTQAEGKHYVLMLSKEIHFQADLLGQALELASYNHLLALGFYRQQWWQSYQWMVPQNTCCLWNVNEKYYFEGFDARCDGIGETIQVGSEKIPVAGMEDFYHLLKVLKNNPHDLRWGMLGMRSPLEWDQTAKNDVEMRRHKIKVLRQQRVMQLYAKEFFPHETWESVQSRFFASCRICR